MRDLGIGLKILFIICCTSVAHAQKAYDVFAYKATVGGSVVKLELAEGYLLASKVTFHSRFGDQVYAPNENEPNAAGDLKLDLVKGTGCYKGDTGSWLLLKGLRLASNAKKISAVFWNGKIQKPIIFRQSK